MMHVLAQHRLRTVLLATVSLLISDLAHVGLCTPGKTPAEGSIAVGGCATDGTTGQMLAMVEEKVLVGEHATVPAQDNMATSEDSSSFKGPYYVSAAESVAELNWDWTPTSFDRVTIFNSRPALSGIFKIKKTGEIEDFMNNPPEKLNEQVAMRTNENLLRIMFFQMILKWDESVRDLRTLPHNILYVLKKYINRVIAKYLNENPQTLKGLTAKATDEAVLLGIYVPLYYAIKVKCGDMMTKLEGLANEVKTSMERWTDALEERFVQDRHYCNLVYGGKSISRFEAHGWTMIFSMFDYAGTNVTLFALTTPFSDVNELLPYHHGEPERTIEEDFGSDDGDNQLNITVRAMDTALRMGQLEIWDEKTCEKYKVPRGDVEKMSDFGNTRKLYEKLLITYKLEHPVRLKDVTLEVDDQCVCTVLNYESLPAYDCFRHPRARVSDSTSITATAECKGDLETRTSVACDQAFTPCASSVSAKSLDDAFFDERLGDLRYMDPHVNPNLPLIDTLSSPVDAGTGVSENPGRPAYKAYKAFQELRSPSCTDLGGAEGGSKGELSLNEKHQAVDA